jgi:hypothetical protein
VSQRRAYEVTLEGVDALDMPLSLLRDLCDVLVEGTQRATRLSVEGRSVVSGKVPAWLASAVDLRVGRYERGSLSLAVSAPELHDIAPELFSHQQPFSEVLPPDATALDVFLGAADDAIAGRRDSERLDAGVLEVLTRASSLLSRGVTRLSIGRTGQQRRITVDTVSAQHIQTLAETTPTPRVERVTGVLDALTVSTRTLVLRLDAGKVLRGLAVGETLETLKALLGHRVVIEGAVTFRPSGDALRIEVDHAAPATAGDDLWARIPHVDVGSVRLSLPPSTPALKDLFGHWPGDETEDDLFLALEQLS